MKSPLPTRKLPERPDLGQLKRQAKELLEAFLGGDAAAAAEVHRFYHAADPATFALHDAQLALARSYGFDSWPKIKAYVDGVTVERLANAVRAGDVEQTRAILKIRPELINVPMAWNNEHTALHYAVLGRMPEMVRLLMQHGANARVGISPRNDATAALTIATEREYSEIVGIIQEEEQRRDAAQPPPDEPAMDLRRALQSGDEDGAIAILERHPALIRLPMPGGGPTVLQLASAILLRRLAVWLLDHGAEVNQQGRNGATALDVAGRFRDTAAKREGVPGMAQLLLARGARIGARSAVILGDADFLRARHAEGALSEPLDSDGWLLGLAAEYDRPDMLQLLLEFGLGPDARARVDPEGVEEVSFTWGMPLYHCARYGKHEMARMLLEKGADPNGQVYASGTPLSEAFGQRDEKTIALLEQYGGKPNPGMAGLYRRKDLALRLLAEHGDTKLPDDGFGGPGTVAEKLLGAAARGGDPEILKMAIDRLDWPAGDPRWSGALTAPLGFWNHWIGPWCHPEWDRTTYLTCFKLLLERSGPPVRRGRFGTTLLHEIVMMDDHVTPEEQVAFAAAALDAGAPLDLRDDLLQSTPLGWACRWGRAELVRFFLDRGADPVEPGAETWATPRAWARKMGHETVLAMLPVPSQASQLKIQSQEVYACAFHPAGTRVLTGAQGNPAQIWDVETGACLGVLEANTAGSWGIAWHADGRHALIGGRDQVVRLWDVETGRCLQELKGHTGFVRCVDLRPDLHRALSGSGARDSAVRLWDLENARCLRTMEGHTDGVYSVAFDSRGQRALSGSRDQTVRVWDLDTGRCVAVMQGHTYHVQCAAWAPDDRRALSCSSDIRLWEIETGRCLRVFEGHTDTIRTVAWSADQRYALSASHDRTVRIWEVESGRCLRVLEGYPAGVVHGAWSADHRRVLSCDWKGGIRVWNLPE